MSLRALVLGAAAAMGAVEVVAVFVEAPYALMLAAIFFLLAVWFWRRNSAWAAVLLAVWFLLELLYLGDYDWDDNGDRLMILLTVAVSGVGLLAAVGWLLQSRRRRP